MALAQHAVSRDRTEPQAISPARRPRAACPDAPLGNQAHLCRLAPAPVALQAKLAIGAVDDPLEREADAVAEQVMRMADPGLSVGAAPLQISRKCADCEEEDKQELQMKPGVAGREAPAIVHEVLRSPGQPLDGATRAFFESRLNADLSAVRIHDDALAIGSARAVGARAYTVGAHVVFNTGYDAPTTGEDRYLLAHELAHVLQQSAASAFDLGSPSRPARQAARTTFNADAARFPRLARQASGEPEYNILGPTMPSEAERELPLPGDGVLL